MMKTLLIPGRQFGELNTLLGAFMLMFSAVWKLTHSTKLSGSQVVYPGSSSLHG
jgi:hypothetical protein